MSSSAPGWFSGMTRWRGNARWILYFTPRNPPGPSPSPLGERAGVHGVRMPEMPDWYWKTLGEAYTFLTGRGAPKLAKGFPPLQIYLVTRGDGETAPVLVNQITKQGAAKQALGILIQLPVRNPSPTWEAELAQALSTVVHELVHALNMQVLPLGRLGMNLDVVRRRYLDLWEWLDEGMAVAAEAAFAEEQRRLLAQGDPSALPVNNDWLYWALQWVDCPECALDDRDMLYQAGLFVRYLERRMGAQFLHQIWAASARVWDPVPPNDCTPLGALQKVCHRHNLEFCSADVADVFASGYCFDSYFLNDPQSKAFEPEVFQRFRERAVTRTWRMEFPAEWPDGRAEKYALPGLACRYFRFMPPIEAGCLVVRVLPSPGKPAESIRSLKAEIAFAHAQSDQSDNGYCLQGPTGAAFRTPLSGSGELTCEIPEFSKASCAHAVLVVTNCAYSPSASTQVPSTSYKQSAEFCVEARLI